MSREEKKVRERTRQPYCRLDVAPEIRVTCATRGGALRRYHACPFNRCPGDLMTSIATLANHQVRLAKRPVGTPTRDNWTFTTEPVQEPGAGGVLIKTLALSLDPAMRGWMNDAK